MMRPSNMDSGLIVDLCVLMDAFVFFSAFSCGFCTVCLHVLLFLYQGAEIN